MANQTINPILDPSNPYYLHPNENPESGLVSTLLNGENYHPWSRAMTMALETKNKLEFINGTLTKPAALDPMYAAWKRCNNLVVSWLSHSIEPSIVQSVLWMDSAQEIWNDLKERYHQGDMFRISELIGEMHSIKQGSGSIDKFYTQMKGVWQQLDNYIPIPPCYCETKCHCALIPTIKKYRENEYIICFLRGLNEQFSYVRSQIMLMEPMPLISKVFSILVQQERQMSFEEPGFSANISSKNYDSRSRGRARSMREPMAGRSNNQGRFGRGRGHKICTYCQKTGHTVDICYKKHGFPPGYFTNSTNINCYSGTDAQMIESLTETEQNGTKEEKVDPICLFTPAQHNALKNMIQESMKQTSHTTNQVSSLSTSMSSFETTKAGTSLNSLTNNSTSSCWVLDTGATDHVCHSLTLYQNFKRIKPLLIALPNGEQVTTHHSGTIVFSDDLYLTDVLHVPTFNFNLISISKLTTSLACTLTFYTNHCQIQEPHSLSMIGAAKLKGCLYVLTQSSKKNFESHHVNVYTGYDDSNVWHSRLGHLSHKKMTIMQSVFPSIKCNKSLDPCEICHLAKHKKLPFNDSSSKSQSMFDLVHVDIWGPISTPSTFGHKYFLTIVDDKTRFTWVHFMKQKSEATILVKTFV
ncbi:PREDICTED: uncharacterized protein LOC109344676 [Lupinus angustifolius]|uniref:uncharacterized protein LOC109344676 n=1 Tax=Lupinus angustifolius TaxID=3871 RepID=UPI00092E9B5F|nr:PREDICTED: uncharacterized protein LOC109344676 [Lupinus angustifolius]